MADPTLDQVPDALASALPQLIEFLLNLFGRSSPQSDQKQALIEMLEKMLQELKGTAVAKAAPGPVAAPAGVAPSAIPAAAVVPDADTEKLILEKVTRMEQRLETMEQRLESMGKGLAQGAPVTPVATQLKKGIPAMHSLDSMEAVPEISAEPTVLLKAATEPLSPAAPVTPATPDAVAEGKPKILPKAPPVPLNKERPLFNNPHAVISAPAPEIIDAVPSLGKSLKIEAREKMESLKALGRLVNKTADVVNYSFSHGMEKGLELAQTGLKAVKPLVVKTVKCLGCAGRSTLKKGTKLLASALNMTRNMAIAAGRIAPSVGI